MATYDYIDKTVYIAAGHGNGDVGATRAGHTEANETIQITDLLYQKLIADGQINVVKVPHSLGLVDGVAWANSQVNALDDGVFIEIHKNSCGSCGASGVETFSGQTATSRDIAQLLHDKIASVTGLPDRGRKDHTQAAVGSLHVITAPTTWSFLVEMGFIDYDPNTSTWDDIYAQSIFEGILNIWDLVPATPQPQTTWQPLPANLAGTWFVNGSGVKLYDTSVFPAIQTNSAYNDNHQIGNIVDHRWINGVEFYRTSYSSSNGLERGFRKSDLDRPTAVNTCAQDLAACQAALVTANNTITTLNNNNNTVTTQLNNCQNDLTAWINWYNAAP